MCLGHRGRYIRRCFAVTQIISRAFKRVIGLVCLLIEQTGLFIEVGRSPWRALYLVFEYDDPSIDRPLLHFFLYFV